MMVKAWKDIPKYISVKICIVRNHALFQNKAPKPKIVADQERTLLNKIKILWYLPVDKVTSNNKKMPSI